MEKFKIKTSKYLYEEHDLLWSEDAQEYITTDVLMDLSGLTREELLSVFTFSEDIINTGRVYVGK